MATASAARRVTAVALVGLAVLTALVAGAGAAGAAPAGGRAGEASAVRDAARAGAHYLAGRRDAAGAIPPGARPDQVAEAALALIAAGGPPDALAAAMGYVEREGPAGATSGPWAARVVLAAVAAGADPRSFGAVDYVRRVEEAYDPVTGSFGGPNLYADAIAMVALAAAGEEVPEGAVARLEVNQCPDGGWSHQAGCLRVADTDTTAMALMALVAAGQLGDPEDGGDDGAAVVDGRRWLATTQSDSGCWGVEAGEVDNANSCGLALSALAALGEDPAMAPWRGGGRDPIAALLALQERSGGFRYRADIDGANDYATVQALPGLVGQPLPLRVTASPPPDPAGMATGGAAPGSRGTAPPAGSAGDADQPGSAGEVDVLASRSGTGGAAVAAGGRSAGAARRGLARADGDGVAATAAADGLPLWAVALAGGALAASTTGAGVVGRRLRRSGTSGRRDPAAAASKT